MPKRFLKTKKYISQKFFCRHIDFYMRFVWRMAEKSYFWGRFIKCLFILSFFLFFSIHST